RFPAEGGLRALSLRIPRQSSLSAWEVCQIPGNRGRGIRREYSERRPETCNTSPIRPFLETPMNATKENPQRTSSERSAGSPKQGEKFRCSKCGMELQ